MVVNQTEWSSLEKMFGGREVQVYSNEKFTEKYVICTEKHVSQNMFTNSLDIGLLVRAWVEKTLQGVESLTHR